MSGRESLVLHTTPMPSQQQGAQGIKLAFSGEGTAVYRTRAEPSSYTSSGGAGNIGSRQGLNMNMGDSMKKKRGRPRKYGPDISMALAISPIPLNPISPNPTMAFPMNSIPPNPTLAVPMNSIPPNPTIAVPMNSIPPNPTISLATNSIPPNPISPNPTMALAMSPIPPNPTTALIINPISSNPASPAVPQLPPVVGAGPSSSSMKRPRGRPPGSGKKQQMAALGSSGVGFMPPTNLAVSSAVTFTPNVNLAGSSGVGFTLPTNFAGFVPNVIFVKTGEDVSSLIMSYSQSISQSVCIISASGAISNVTLRQSATSGGTVTYEGRYEILTLSGSFVFSETGAQRSRSGGLSVTLAGPDGRVVGGGVAGLLTAASPVQVIVGGFTVNGHYESKPTQPSDPSAQLNIGTGGMSGIGSPPSRGPLNEPSGGPGSPPNLCAGPSNNSAPQGMASMPWN
ncbi:AT hook motif DNA-binding family protein isoform X2 [Tasmannia lanceolata]|uniref:AT hook motif DNA-binding family protein isoform X2 n=1 Tax=Tasmannia lanceolata TaxID=3420 RepID=UPI004064886D